MAGAKRTFRSPPTRGAGKATSPTAIAGVLEIVETTTNDGGTGRVAGATGSHTDERLFEPPIGSFARTVAATGARQRRNPKARAVPASQQPPLGPAPPRAWAAGRTP